MSVISWPLQEDVQILLIYGSSGRPSIQLTMEEESKDQLAFLDVLLTCAKNGFKIFLYHETTFTGQYLHFNSTISIHYKTGIIQCLQHHAKMIVGNQGTN